jgi:hypothetical protein
VIIGCNTYGQENLYINQRCGGTILRPTKTTKVTSLTQLPTRIPQIIDKVFKSSLTDFNEKIFFIQGQVLDIEKFAERDSNFQSMYQYVLPKYFLEFELRDTTIGINSYCLQVSLDQYGQVIKLNWPRSRFNKQSSFIAGYLLKIKAIEFAKKLHYKTSTSFYQLRFNEERNAMEWHFYFLQKQANGEDGIEKEYQTISVNAVTKEVFPEVKISQSGPIR